MVCTRQPVLPGRGQNVAYGALTRLAVVTLTKLRVMGKLSSQTFTLRTVNESL